MDCACYCKDTHFEAIHNAGKLLTSRLFIVLATAKIHILKQFTTNNLSLILIIWLCLLLQRYTFWSNSQPHRNAHGIERIVLATAKIHILKQFTTLIKAGRTVDELCLLLQRYTFWSNSQPSISFNSKESNCACYCKDTHFEAIHNQKQ